MMARNDVPFHATLTALVLNLAAAGLLALAACLFAALGVGLSQGILVAEDRDTLLLLEILRKRVPLLFLAAAMLMLAAAWAWLRAHAAWLGRRSGFWSAQRKAVAASVLGLLLAAHHAFSPAGTGEGLAGGVFLVVAGLLALGVMLGAGEPDPLPRGGAQPVFHGQSLRPGWRSAPARLGDTARSRRGLR